MYLIFFKDSQILNKSFTKEKKYVKLPFEDEVEWANLSGKLQELKDKISKNESLGAVFKCLQVFTIKF